MKRAINLLVAGAFALALIAPGCYTVVSHPKDERGYTASQRSDCLKCHGDYSEYPYGYYYSPYPEYWWDYDKYGLYYAYPWWWDYYHQADDRDSRFADRDPHDTPPPPIIIVDPPPHHPSPRPPYPWPSPPGNPGPPGKPSDNEESRGKTENGDAGKETRQSEVGKQSGPKTESTPATDNSGSTTETTPSPGPDAKKDRRGGKP